MRLGLLAFLVGCGSGKPASHTDVAETDTDTDTDADADTDSDADGDTDTDVATDTGPFVEDCANGLDDDADGDIDCVDADCDPACDADGDGVWNYVHGGQDCDDGNGLINPSQAEICNSIDDNCDGRIDDDDPLWDPMLGITQYEDKDGDTWGSVEDAFCEPQVGWVLVSGDCDDQNPAIHPDANEVCDNLDDDCDSLTDDADDSLDPAFTNPFFLDADHDGSGDPTQQVQACHSPPGYVSNDLDCDDGNAAVNGNTQWLLDADGDGIGAPGVVEVACVASGPDEVVSDGQADCDDGDPASYPGAPEICWDGVDQDCNGVDDCHPMLRGTRNYVGTEVAGDPADTHTGQRISVGDVDGDGVAELAVESDLGTAILGPVLAAGSVLPNDAIATGGPGAPLLGGDLDGDGVGDLAWTNGAVYLFSGPLGGVFSPPGASGVVTGTGTPTGEAATGDLDGDGQDDLAAIADDGVDGAIWVVPGPISGGVFASAGIAGAAGAGLPAGAVAVGDLDGDGVAELAASDPLVDAGEIRVFVDPSNAVAAADAWWTLTGAAGDQLGGALSIGDADGDGAPDLGFTRANGIEVFHGPLDPAQLAADLTVSGTAVDALGAGIAIAGDIDGDGVGEIGASGWIYGQDAALYVLDGGDTGSLGLAVGYQLWQVLTRGEQVGPVAAGDLDGDGYGDLAAGAPRTETGLGTDETGRAIVVFGSPL